jgi:cyclophilin family peptidyl-prolyl cis-trans isomerase
MKKFNIVLLAALAASLLALPVAAQDAQTPDEICQAALPAADPATREYTQAEQVLQPDTDYHAIFCTDAGAVYVDLYEQYAPITVNNFVFLAEAGYYNNTTFHRVIQDFMAQAGDPTATGSGGPGYQFTDEFVGFLTFANPGVLAMANAGPETNGSQFFITTAPTEHLNLRHTIFGQVLDGQDKVAAIQLRDPATATEPGTLLQTVIIVTDPTTVVSTYEAPALATQEEVVAAFDGVAALLPPDNSLGVDDAFSGLSTSEEIVAAAPEAEQAALGDFLTRHNFEYRVSNKVANTSCDLTTSPFVSIAYTLDAYASPEDAAAALADEELEQITLQNGFTESAASENLDYPLFTETTTACDVPAVRSMTYWQRGRFIASAEIIAPADGSIAQTPDVSLSQGVAIIYEPILADVLRREIR